MVPGQAIAVSVLCRRRLGVLHSVAKQGYRKVNSPTLAAGKDSLVIWDQRPLLKLPLLCVS